MKKSTIVAIGSLISVMFLVGVCYLWQQYQERQRVDRYFRKVEVCMDKCEAEYKNYDFNNSGFSSKRRIEDCQKICLKDPSYEPSR